MKRLTLKSMAGLGALMLATTVSAQSFNASRTFEFDPDHTGGAVAKWSSNIGLQDFQGSGNTKFGLRLEKNVPIDAVVAAGAVLNGLKGVVVNAGDTMGYDMKNDSTATTVGSGPRFNVSWTLAGVSNFSFVGGSNNATRTPACQNPATWTTYRLNLQDPAQAHPPIPAGAVLQSVVLILDEPGQNTLDNINFRNQIAAKSGNSANSTGCP
ncbi:MAG: hypothetical protein DMF06_10795 [Verrucomicrobia bacterium]|nr:MAG: hypothetical protein DMF06_10795 [Verrucomicrobiota bacterium]